MPRIIIVLSALIATALPTAATAGTFTAYSCKTPSGVFTGMDGWTSSASSPVVGRDSGSSTTCSSSTTPFSLQFGGTGLPVASGSWLKWTLSAPTGTTIKSFSLSRSFNLSWPVVPGVANRPYAYQVSYDDNET